MCYTPPEPQSPLPHDPLTLTRETHPARSGLFSHSAQSDTMGPGPALAFSFLQNWFSQTNLQHLVLYFVLITPVVINEFMLLLVSGK